MYGLILAHWTKTNLMSDQRDNFANIAHRIDEIHTNNNGTIMNHIQKQFECCNCINSDIDAHVFSQNLTVMENVVCKSTEKNVNCNRQKNESTHSQMIPLFRCAVPNDSTFGCCAKMVQYLIYTTGLLHLYTIMAIPNIVILILLNIAEYFLQKNYNQLIGNNLIVSFVENCEHEHL